MRRVSACKWAGYVLPAVAASLLSSTALAQVQLPLLDVISATTIPTPIEQIGSSVTVFTAADIEREQRRTIPDLLQTVPGVHVVQTGSPGMVTSIFMRGTNSNHTKVFVDGIDIGDPSSTNGAVDFGHLTTMDLERVEILRGPQSGLYGADAIGGVISLTTKKGSGPTKVTAMAEGGSFGTFNQAAGVGGSHGSVNYQFNVSHFRTTDTQVTPIYMVPPGIVPRGNYYDNVTMSTRFGGDVNPYLGFNFYGRATEAKNLFYDDNPFAFPGVILPDQTTYRNRSLYGRAETVVTLFDGRFVNVFGANYTSYDRSSFNPDMATFSPFNSQRNKYDWRGTIKAAPGHTVVLGAEREIQSAQTTDVNASTGNTAGYAELQSEFFERLFVVANVRKDSHDDFGDATTWRVAPAFIVPVSETKLKGSAGTGFKAPTLYQLYGTGPFGFRGNPNLRPERSKGFDVGFEQPLANNRVRFGVTYFHNEITDLIDFTFVPFTNVNVNDAVLQGYEAFAEVVWSPSWRSRFDYTYVRAWDRTNDVELRRRPREKFSANTIWTPFAGFTLSATLIHVGSWVDVNRATFAIEQASPYTTVNVAAEYIVNNNVTVFARVDNLFNKVYENPLGWLQPGLGVFGGIRVANR
jgi:vitamin B12 transporter